MKKILVLGAGLVTRPLVRYLLNQPDFYVTVASRTRSKAEAIVAGHPCGATLALDVSDEAALESAIASHDLSISMLPYVHHPTVARLCIKHRKHMVTTSYVSEAMRAMDDAAREAGIIILNEIGVDPGIDHMSAMRVIDRIHAHNGRVLSFTSWCGGLPAPEANTNPLGYKFSWSPRGVLLAAKNPARFLKDGQVVEIPGEKLFDHYEIVPIESLGDFEGHGNRNALPYIDTYGIPETKSMFRGTLRNIGWCPTMKRIVELGLLDTTERDDLAGLTFAQLTAQLIGQPDATDLKAAVAARLGLERDSQVMHNLEWLGLFGNDPVPAEKTLLDVLTAQMLKLMAYQPGERDMLIQQHEIIAEYPDHKEKTVATMIDFGIPYGDTSMSRTVGLPAAIGTRLILEGQIQEVGVHIPVKPVFYEPVLNELAELGIALTEKTEILRICPTQDEQQGVWVAISP